MPDDHGVAGSRAGVVFVGLVLGLVTVCGACLEERTRPTVPVFGDLALISDPAGAEITVDGGATGRSTPDTLDGLTAGPHFVELRLESENGELFLWRDSVMVPEEDQATVRAALEGGCAQNCPFRLNRGRVICRVTGRGDTCAGAFFSQAALAWPGPDGGSFSAGGRLLAAAVLDDDAGTLAGDTVASFVFRETWLGRRPVESEVSGRSQMLELEYWAGSGGLLPSLLGLSVQQTVLAVDSATVEDMIFIRFRVTNVTDDPLYQRNFPGFIPGAGYTFRSLYLGFGLDADVGAADDDLGTFDADRDLAFMYDADLRDQELDGQVERPGLVGLTTVEPPAGATRRTFTLWRAQDDWEGAGLAPFGWRVLAGELAPTDPIQDHPAAEIGFAPDVPDDYRLTEAHGPLTLAPGESVELTVALMLAEPTPGSFVPGQTVDPGDPLSSNRQILEVAEGLRSLALDARELWTRYRP